MRRLPLFNPFGSPVYHEETVSSTMDVSRTLAAGGEGHGTVIAADFQEAGRGSRGRSWQADRGLNLFFTILLRYPGFASVPRGITLRTGLALSLAIEDFVPALAGLVWVKWPNDVMIGLKKGETAALKARKTAGILSEGDEHTLFIGIGVNVAQTGFPQEYRSKATSIALALSALNRSPAGGDRSAPERIFSAEDRFPLLEKILLRLFEEFSPPENPGLSESWRGRLEERLYLKGLPVSFVPRSAAEAGGRAPDKDGPCQTVEGRLEGIGPGGELLILPKDALRPLSFVSGELQVYT